MNLPATEEKKGSRSILVVEDDLEVLHSYEQLLSQRGWHVQTCANGSEAVTLIKEHAYDVVVLDIRLPGIEGTDLLPIMKKLHPDLPVIVVSAYYDDSNPSYYHRLGAFEMLRKPITSEMLLDAIGRALDQQERIPVVLNSLSLREGRDRVYRKLILAALQKTNWNQVKASKLLGVSRYCLMRWIQKLGIA